MTQKWSCAPSSTRCRFHPPETLEANTRAKRSGVICISRPSSMTPAEWTTPRIGGDRPARPATAPPTPPPPPAGGPPPARPGRGAPGARRARAAPPPEPHLHAPARQRIQPRLRLGARLAASQQHEVARTPLGQTLRHCQAEPTEATRDDIARVLTQCRPALVVGQLEPAAAREPGHAARLASPGDPLLA